jgi:hypothetical protein
MWVMTIRSERSMSLSMNLIYRSLTNSSINPHIHATGYLRHGCTDEQDARSCKARSETAGGRAFAATSVLRWKQTLAVNGRRALLKAPRTVEDRPNHRLHR